MALLLALTHHVQEDHRYRVPSGPFQDCDDFFFASSSAKRSAQLLHVVDNCSLELNFSDERSLEVETALVRRLCRGAGVSRMRRTRQRDSAERSRVTRLGSRVPLDRDRAHLSILEVLRPLLDRDGFFTGETFLREKDAVFPSLRTDTE